jgi:hypothetical protein
MKPTFKKRTPCTTEPCKPKDRELQRQLGEGRKLMRRYVDTFRALAK